MRKGHCPLVPEGFPKNFMQMDVMKKYSFKKLWPPKAAMLGLILQELLKIYGYLFLKEKKKNVLIEHVLQDLIAWSLEQKHRYVNYS